MASKKGCLSRDRCECS